ncbi:MAG: signal peptidase I [Roseburia sp.]
MEEFKVEDLNEDGGTSVENKIDSAKEEKKEETISPIREVLSWVLTFAAAILAALFIKEYLIINADVPTGSMENTIMPGDRLIGNRLAYLKEGPERGDIVVFRYPDNEEELFVKRVIGLPGETVVLENGKVYIDGEELEEPYLKEEWTVATGPYTFEVPEGCYLMLGDNRNNSKDSRYWDNTYVSLDKILGKALFVYWPISDWGSLSD